MGSAKPGTPHDDHLLDLQQLQPLITSLGVGSGLHLSTLLTQLTTAAQTPLTQIKNCETAYQTSCPPMASCRAC